MNLKMLSATWKGVLLLSLASSTLALDNGLALTPPMGWMSWERFRCVTDCVTYPSECIGERLYREMAERIAADGFSAAGYEYLIIDDCWSSKERDSNGELQADPVRFPNGIKALADYVHSLGLKFGIYGDYGTLTCGGYPGSINHLEQDANTFAKWGADYVKFDGCYAEPFHIENAYIEFGQKLLATNRSIVYSCSYPTYQDYAGIDTNMTILAEHCNLWRNYDDIDDSWNSVMTIVDWFTKKQEIIAPFAGPGHWNDPDMLIIGNFGLSLEQSKAQMAIWAILTGPLIMSNDLRNIRPEFKEILLNKDIIAVNQDPLGKQGLRTYMDDFFIIWTKPIQPIVNGATSFAFTVLNKRIDGIPRSLNVTLERLGVVGAPAYSVTELFSGVGPLTIPGNGNISFRIAPTGSKMFRAVALKSGAHSHNRRRNQKPTPNFNSIS